MNTTACLKDNSPLQREAGREMVAGGPPLGRPAPEGGSRLAALREDSFPDLYPRLNPRTGARGAGAPLPTELGEFRITGHRSLTWEEEFVVLAGGDLRGGRPPLVRIHSQCLTGDVFGSIKCDCGPQLRAALAMIASEGRGVIVYQQQEG